MFHRSAVICPMRTCAPGLFLNEHKIAAVSRYLVIFGLVSSIRRTSWD